MNVCKCKLIFPTDTLQQFNFLLSFFIFYNCNRNSYSLLEISIIFRWNPNHYSVSHYLPSIPRSKSKQVFAHEGGCRHYHSNRPWLRFSTKSVRDALWAPLVFFMFFFHLVQWIDICDVQFQRCRWTSKLSVKSKAYFLVSLTFIVWTCDFKPRLFI